MAESSDSDSIPCGQKSPAGSPMVQEETTLSKLSHLSEQVLQSKLNNADVLQSLSAVLSETYFKTEQFKPVYHFGNKLISLVDAFDAVSELRPQLSDLLKTIFPLYLEGEVFTFYKLHNLNKLTKWCCLRRAIRLANIKHVPKVRTNRVSTI